MPPDVRIYGAKMTEIYCFSGSGHSLAVAEYYARVLNAPLFRLTKNFPRGTEGKAATAKNNGHSRETGKNRLSRVFVVFPVYCQAIPDPVKDFLKNLHAGNVTLIATYGGISHGNVLQKAQKITPARICAAAYLPTGHTYLPDGRTEITAEYSGSPAKHTELPAEYSGSRTERAASSAEYTESPAEHTTSPAEYTESPAEHNGSHTGYIGSYAESRMFQNDFDTVVLDRLLAANGENEVRIPFSAHHPLAGFFPGTRSRIAVKLRKNADCTSCGICTAACPFGEMQNGIAGRHCRRCLACVVACPRHALSFTRSRILTRYLLRHTHPGAKAEVFL